MGNNAADKKARVRRWERFESVAFPRLITREADRYRRVAQPKADPDALKRSEELGCFPIQTQIEFDGVWDTVGAVGMPIDEMWRLVNWICPRKSPMGTAGIDISLHSLYS